MSEPLCQCGHDKAAHEYEYRLAKGHCSHGGTNGVPACRCRRFTPSSPPARSRAEAEKAITAVLDQHAPSYQVDGDYGERQWIECICGSEYFVNTDAGYAEHNAHVASVLADLMADAPTLADAWDDGWNECLDHRDCTYAGPGECPDAPPNPHRVVDTEGDR